MSKQVSNTDKQDASVAPVSFLDVMRRATPFRLWAVAVLSSVLLTELIASGISLLLKGRVDPDFLFSGLVASLLVSSFVVGLITWMIIELRHDEGRLMAIFSCSPVGIAVGRLADAQVFQVNDALCTLLGYRQDELLAQPGLLSPLWLDAAPRELLFSRLAREEEIRNLPAVLRHKSGQVRHLSVSAEVVALQGEAHYLVMMHDETERALGEKRRQSAHAILEKIIEELPMGALLVQEGKILFSNTELCRLLESNVEALIGQSFVSLTHDNDRLALSDFLAERIMDPGMPAALELRLFNTEGGHFPARVHARVVDWDGLPATICLVENISEHKVAEEKIRNLAFFDPLTGLPNRRLMLDRLRVATATTQRSRAHGALVFIDLDNFKMLNDTRGHDVGDLLLKEVADRLTKCVRDEDTVARLGGDEFVMLLGSLSVSAAEAQEQSEIVGRKILSALDQPYYLGGIEHHASASMGIALFQGQGEACDQVLKRADLAMYHAKFAGRATMRFFEPAMQAAVDARSAMEADLRRAIRQDEFELYYQPQVDALGRVIGAEALVRWKNKTGEPLSPAQFMPLAEESGLILPMSKRILEQACGQLTVWARSPETAGLTLAVNVSARHFRSPNFIVDVRVALSNTGARPDRLILELAEEIQMDDTTEKMETLRALGVRFSLDHFGAGYSSLSYLKRLPISQVKISHTFIREILSDANDAAITRAIIAMAISLGLEVIAAGVETREQWDFLLAEGCLQGQGYLFGHAVPAARFDPTRPRLT